MGIKISELPVAGSIDGTELVPIVQTGTTKQTTIQDFIAYPVAVDKGGTGATDASTARTNLSAAKSGANTDITSLDSPEINSATADTQSVLDNSTKVATTAYSDVAGRSKIFPINASVGSNALTIVLDPCILDFHSTTLGNGIPVTRVVSSQISIVVSSGSTLGTTSGLLNNLVVFAIDNAGTVELAVGNLGGGHDLSETNLISTTAEGGVGNADSASIIYSTAARSNVAYRIVGLVRSTQATAGTWATAPSLVQGAGGLNRLFSTVTMAASVATTSGTSIDFTGIPIWARTISIMLNGVSTSGTSPIRVQLGDSGGIENTGYASNALTSSTSTAVNTSNSTAGFDSGSIGSSSNSHSGSIILSSVGSNIWVCQGSISNTGDSRFYSISGGKTLSDTLTQIRMTTVGGTDTFDAGTINISWI